MHSGTRSGGGGTNAALPGRVPPIRYARYLFALEEQEVRK